MIVDEVKEEIFSNFTGEEQSFSIDATSSHIFEILRNKQYANGKESLVRELIANAKDSHAEAGKSDVPIKIWLNSNYLTIQDFGVGLSPERIRDVYLCFGKSTKRNTNGQQGFYGIGAKSFFAYASAASITSIHDGVKREYSAYLNETNVGAFRLISEHPTDECNGVSIKIPIQKEHFHEFRGYVKKYAQFMEVTPEIIGDNIYGPTAPPKIVMEGTGWRMYESGELSKFNVLLDGIPYRYENYNTPSGVTFIFSTGEMIPSATRESLQVSQFNTDAFNKAIQVFKDEIKQKIETQLAATTDFYEVINLIHSSKKFFSLQKTNWKWANGTLTYPLENYALRCRRGYSCLEKYSVQTLDDIKPGSFILVDENFDYSEVKGHITRKINHHREQSKCGVAYLVRPSHGIPTELTTKLDDIKITYGNGGAAGPKLPRKKGPKTHIMVQLKGKSHKSRYAIDNPLGSKTPVIYTTDLTLFNNYKNYNILNISRPVEVSESDVKHIKGKPNWYTIQEYIHENLTKSFTKAELELEYKKKQSNDACQQYIWLKDYVSDDLKIAFEPSKLNNEHVRVLQFIIDNGELDVKTDDPPDIVAKYPLLGAIETYYIKDVPGHTNYYSTKAHFNDVVKYIQLINQETKKTRETENVSTGS
jgi:hypothetical protein